MSESKVNSYLRGGGGRLKFVCESEGYRAEGRALTALAAHTGTEGGKFREPSEIVRFPFPELTVRLVG